jgi:hypothetical protein
LRILLPMTKRDVCLQHGSLSNKGSLYISKRHRRSQIHDLDAATPSTFEILTRTQELGFKVNTIRARSRNPDWMLNLGFGRQSRYRENRRVPKLSEHSKSCNDCGVNWLHTRGQYTNIRYTHSYTYTHTNHEFFQSWRSRGMIMKDAFTHLVGLCMKANQISSQ